MKKKQSTAINIDFFEDARQQLEKFSSNMAIFNKNGPLFLDFL